MKKVLVLCTGNSCRSQMAEGYLKYFAGNKAEIYSAGIEKHGVNVKAIQTMQSDGIDISNQQSNNVTEYSNVEFDYVITVCDNANEQCPIFPSKAVRFHHNFADPAKAIGREIEIMEQFRNVRNEIKEYCRDFISTYL